MIKSLRFLAVATVAVFALAACDEGDSNDATISGSVTAEGTGLAGVTVSLSSGATTTTDASGNYSFSQLGQGSYVVTIAGFPSDATFQSTTQTAVVGSSGQAVTIDFSGSFVRTSSITGNVLVADVGGLSGVTVTLSGTDDATTTTDAAGQYAFSGLRAGDYTVTLSGFDAATYDFTPASQVVTVGAGAAEVVSFAGTQVANATISGALFLDENDKNNAYDGAALEVLFNAPNVLITLKGPEIGQSQTTQTDSTGSFAFTDLVSGNYSVSINPSDPDIPALGAFGGDSTEVFVTLAPGGTQMVYFPFDIMQQMVSVCVFTGLDAVSPGHNPVPGGSITLYPRRSDADAGSNEFGTQSTDATGCTEFTFDRADDTSPQPGFTDNIVFAEINGTPAGNYYLNGENRIEFNYDSRSAFSLASDTFDVQTSNVTFALDAYTITMSDTLAGWNWSAYMDTTAANIASGVTDAAGRGYINVNSLGVTTLPDTLHARLNVGAGQPSAMGHGFNQTPMADDLVTDSLGNTTGGASTAAGRHLQFVHDGFNLDGDTVYVGYEEVRFTDADIEVVVYHETDDSLTTPMFTGGDDMVNVDEVDVTLWYVPSDTTAPVALSTQTATAVTGVVTFPNFFTDSTYAISAQWNGTGGSKKILMDTVYVGLQEWGGASFVANQCQLEGSAGCATFAHKYTNNTIQGTVRAADGTDADGITVKITADPMTIEADPMDTTLVTSGGSYFLGGVTEGMYTVSVMDSIDANGDSIWVFADTTACLADNQGNAGNEACSFVATRMDTKIIGVVVNDRDIDQSTLDPNEALPGVTMSLYRGVGTSADSLVTTSVTDANGVYSFEKLREGQYTVHSDASTSGAAVTVLQGIDAAGMPIDTQIVVTAATTTSLGTNMTRQDGDSTAPNPGLAGLPYWLYGNANVAFDDPAHFTHLFNNTIVRGVVNDGAASPVAGVTATLRRCLVAAGFTSPPTAGACTTFHPDAPMNASTDASGMFEFIDLQEGVYQVTINPATGGFATATPGTLLYIMKDSGDIEQPTNPIVVN